jgi:isoleucyl-tRNA synthetase
MALVREIVSLGRSARMGAKLKVRQPIDRVEVVLADPAHKPWLEAHEDLIREELNVKSVEFTDRAERYITYTVLPELKRLGPRLGRRLPELRTLLAESDPAQLLVALETEGRVTCTLAGEPVILTAEDLQVRLAAKEGWAAAQGRSAVVVVSTALTPELVAEGLAREVAHVVNNCRKEMGCQYTDRIRLTVVTAAEELLAAIRSFEEYIKRETLTVDLRAVSLENQGEGTASARENPARQGRSFEVKVAGHLLTLYLEVANEGDRSDLPRSGPTSDRPFAIETP